MTLDLMVIVIVSISRDFAVLFRFFFVMSVPCPFLCFNEIVCRTLFTVFQFPEINDVQIIKTRLKRL